MIKQICFAALLLGGLATAGAQSFGEPLLDKTVRGLRFYCGYEENDANLFDGEAVVAAYLPTKGLMGVFPFKKKADADMPGCFSWSDLDLIRQHIGEIKQSCRWCIVVANAGEEFTALPSPYTRDRYISYLDMGADIVVAHHPHVVNNYELFDDKAIFYSLGNFVFDTDYQRSQYGTEYGILLKLALTDKAFSFEPMGIGVDRVAERIVPCDPPAIFTDVPAGEYEKLKALAAKVLIENTKRQLRYLKPSEYENATEDDFVRNFYEPLRSGRVPGETLDMQIIYPLSLEAANGSWKTSNLQGVVDYMLAQTGP